MSIVAAAEASAEVAAALELAAVQVAAVEVGETVMAREAATRVAEMVAEATAVAMQGGGRWAGGCPAEEAGAAATASR